MTFDRFILSIAPAFFILCILFIKRGDVFNRQGGLLIAKLFLGSLVTMRLALEANSYINSVSSELNLYSLKSGVILISAFAGAFNEEMAKLIPLLLLFYLSKRFQTKKDVFFCVICVGAFFAAFENAYVENYNKMIGTLIERSLTAVPAHLSFACLMAPFLYFSVKDEKYENKHYSVGGVFFDIQLALSFVLLYWYFNHSMKVETSVFKFLKAGALIYFIILAIELSVFLINPKKFKKLLKYNYKLGMLMIAVILPACLHTLHNWSVTRFDGWHLFLTYFCLLSTYILILTYTSFTIDSDQTDGIIIKNPFEDQKEDPSAEGSTWEKPSL